MKKIIILGSSGSIGENALRVIERFPKKLKVAGLAVERNYERVLDQAVKFGVRDVAVADPGMARLCRQNAPRSVRVLSGPGGVEELAAISGADTVVCSVVGMAGLKPVLAAVKQGKDVALATKEVLVVAGRIVTRACARSGSRLLPVDSEHSAIFQCLQASCEPRIAKKLIAPGASTKNVKRIILTASGGPFAGRTDVDLDRVTAKEALAHPCWNMGRKVTIDSATLMNKGLEIMEARWLFGLPLEKIDVVLHPESIVHSMVEFVDGSVLAQMSIPDMRFAIQYALVYPERVDGGLPPLDLKKIGALHFREPETGRFPALDLARSAATRGGTMPAVLNAANEVAVSGFLKGNMTFSGIWKLVEKVMARHEVVDDPSLDDVIDADAWARSRACEMIKKG
ncbi:MAG: 1-deoxy-D-xylulose-5-phosphate reductoisomerase [Verrucomicrobia bacterium]|nr:1-deoxy-D-xylulose-5-phosphate reductoisomerase [Verrucomicrobiota bacterium]